MQIQNYLNGRFQPAVDHKTLAVINPATGEEYATAPASNQKDVALAVAAANAAFPAWSNTTQTARSQVLMRIADRIATQADELALAECIDNGKPLALAKRIDIPRASANFRFFANAITQFATAAHEMQGNAAINYTLRQPLGVVGCISPWNLPLYLFTWKIAPALAAGNCVIAKPSEVTPMTAYLLAKICHEVGLPAGVLNILHGYGQDVGSALTKHPKVKAISFTGSTRVGGEIAKIAAPQFKKLSLEMGGKNPNLIFADCNYDKMLATTVRSSFANQGQICLCGSRIYVEANIYEKFKTDFVKKVQELRVGNPLATDTQVGAVVSKTHFQKILSYIEMAQQEGGTILCGGKAVQPKGHAGGYFITPTVIEGLATTCRTNQEEIFGPVVTLQPFQTEDEVIAHANGTAYGLSATVWTEKLSRAHRVAATLEVGIVWINTWLLRDLRTPFGGVKQSGVGREGGFEALRFFTEAKNVCLQWGG